MIVDTHRPTSGKSDPFNLSKSPLKNFIKKAPEAPNQMSLYEFIQSRNDTIKEEDGFFNSATNNLVPKSSIRNKMNSKPKSVNNKKKKDNLSRNPGQRKNFMELNKKRLNGQKKKVINRQNKKGIKPTKKSHRKVKSQVAAYIHKEEKLYIPSEDRLSDINRIAEKQKLKTPNSELNSQTDVYIENESEYDIVNELKRDILIKEEAKTTSLNSHSNTWNITNLSSELANMNLISGISHVCFCFLVYLRRKSIF